MDEDIFGDAVAGAPFERATKKGLSYVPGVGPAPGEKDRWVNGNDKRVGDFLYPPMPGAFDPWKIRKLAADAVRERYIQVLAATLGNHSIACFYCCLDQDQFDALLTVKFKKRILQAKSQLADRATYIMHRNLGLVRGPDEGDAERPPAPGAIASLAKVVEKLQSSEIPSGNGEGFKMKIEGLDRSRSAPAVPDSPAAPTRPQ